MKLAISIGLLIIIILLIACIIIGLVILLKFVIPYIKEIHEKKLKQYYNEEVEKEKLASLYSVKRSEEDIKYSEQVLKSTKDFIANWVVLEFSSYKDSRDITKVTKQNIVNLAREIVEEIKVSINDEVINWNHVYFSNTYYDKFMISTTIMMLKRIFEDTLDVELS